MKTNDNTSDSIAKARQELIRSIVFISRKITVYSLLEEMTDIQAVFCFSEEELLAFTDDSLLREANALCEYVKLQRIDLDCFGIEQPSLDILINAIQQFSLCRENEILARKIELNQTLAE